jgi:hypothetical protein
MEILNHFQGLQIYKINKDNISNSITHFLNSFHLPFIAFPKRGNVIKGKIKYVLMTNKFS